jgi:hypothetical protein
MMKYVFIGWMFLFCLSLSAQDKKRMKQIQKDAEFYFSNEDYLNALNYYRQLISLDPKNDKAVLNTVICKMKLTYPLDSFQVHEPMLVNSKIPEAKYYMGRIKHKQKLFDLSIAFIEQYRKFPEKKRDVTTIELDYWVAVNKSAIELTNNPHRSVIKNMGPKINTSYPEYVPVVLPDESTMYFTSRREGSSNNKKDAYGNYHEDIYVSHKQGEIWGMAENAGAPLNTETNDACVAVSPDGQRMIIYRAAADGLTGNLFITKLTEENKWGPLVKLGNEINSQFTETSACFSNDTSEIYFSSTRPGGYGGKDIYRIKKLPNGRWAAPFNLGPNINTPYDEDAPYLHPDGFTLYFSSKGHNTMGEYDVFKSEMNAETSKFNKAENLGYPINGVNNDIFFVLNVNGQRAYYSSAREDSYGSTDIYEIDTRFGDNDLKVKAGLLFKDDILGKAKITLLDNETNKVSGIYNSNPKTGKFILVMNPLKSYKAIVQEEGFKPVVLDIEPIASEKEETVLTIKLLKE